MDHSSDRTSHWTRIDVDMENFEVLKATSMACVFSNPIENLVSLDAAFGLRKRQGSWGTYDVI